MNPSDPGAGEHPGGSAQDVHGEALSRVLRAEASRMNPTGSTDDALNRIRARTEAGSAPRSRRWLVPLAAVAAVVALAAVGAAVLPHWPRTGLTAASSRPQPSGSPTGTPSGPSGSSSPSGSPTSTANGRTVTVPVYFGGTFAGRTMLYREYHQSASAPITGAVQAMLAGPSDPDYASLWPAGTTLTSLTRSGSLVTVTLSGAPLLTQPAAGAFGVSSVQEVVYTVTAADTSVRAVTVVYPGGESTAVTRAPSVQVLASVWVLAPTQGANVTSPVTLSGTASVVEATVTWQVDRPDGTVAAEGSTMTTIGAPGRGPWSTVVTLPPGDYLVKVYAVSPKDGSIIWPDTKTFTVR